MIQIMPPSRPKAVKERLDNIDNIEHDKIKMTVEEVIDTLEYIEKLETNPCFTK